MDTSETYIEQCEKATKLQKEWKPKFGDRIKEGFISRIYINGDIGFVTTGGEGRISRELAICIFSQDQLQEMVLKIGNHPWSLFWDIEDWLSKIAGDSYEYINVNKIPFTSMEQLWLAFVMSELYSRRWDGNDWIII